MGKQDCTYILKGHVTAWHWHFSPAEPSITFSNINNHFPPCYDSDNSTFAAVQLQLTQGCLSHCRQVSLQLTVLPPASSPGGHSCELHCHRRLMSTCWCSEPLSSVWQLTLLLQQPLYNFHHRRFSFLCFLLFVLWLHFPYLLCHSPIISCLLNLNYIFRQHVPKASLGCSQIRPACIPFCWKLARNASNQ